MVQASSCITLFGDAAFFRIDLPTNFVKLRCVENHDQARIMALAPSRTQALAWTAFQVFNKGAFLVYGGQESAAEHTPSLFDVDKVQWGDYPLLPFLTALARLKKDPALIHGQFTFEQRSAIQLPGSLLAKLIRGIQYLRRCGARYGATSGWGVP